MPKAIKYILYTLLGLVALILLALLVTQTAPFRNYVRKKALSIAHEQINGTVSLEQIKGNFFTHLDLINVNIAGPEGDTIAAFDRLSLSYDLVPLLSNTIRVDEIVLQSPRLFVKQQPDSTWNFQSLLPATDQPDTSQSMPFGMTIKLGSLKINNGNFNIVMPDTIIPQYLRDFNLEAGGIYSSSLLEAELRELNFITPPHLPDIKHLQVNVNREDSTWTIRDFELVTPQNQLNSEGAYKNMRQFSASLNTENLRVDEFDFFLPDFKLGVTPTIVFNAENENNNLSLQLKLSHQNQSVELSGEVTRFSDFLNDSTLSKARMDLLLTFQNFSPGKWLVLEDMPAMVNGKLTAEGNGLSPDAPPLIVNAILSESSWEPYAFSKLTAKIEYLAGETDAEINLNMGDGELTAKATTNVTDSLSPFNINVEADKFPAHRFLPEWGDSTILTFILRADGEGLLSQSPRGRFNLNMYQSAAAHVPIDTLIIDGDYRDQLLKLDSLELLNKSMRLMATGRMRTDGEVDATLEANFYDIEAFKHYVTSPATWDTLRITGEANGTTDSMRIDFKTLASEIQYEAVGQMESLKLTADGTLTPAGFSGWGNLSAVNGNIAKQNIDSLRLSAQLAPNEWNADLKTDFTSDLMFETKANGNLGSPLKVHIATLQLEHPKEKYKLAGDGANLTLDSAQIKIENLDLTSTTDSLFMFKVDGTYKTGQSINADAVLNHFKLSTLNNLGLINRSLEGILNFNLKAGGPLSEPNLEFTSNVEGLKSDQFAIQKVNLDLTYLKDSANLYMALRGEEADSLVLKGSAPVSISLTDSQMVSSITELDARLLAENFNTNAIFDTESDRKQYLKGLVNTDIKISGKITQPTLKGYLDISEAELSVPAYGIEYKNLVLNTTLDNNRVMLDSLYAENKGHIFVTGNMVFDSTIVSGKISTLSANLKADDFYLSRHENHEIQIDADILFKDSARIATFGGDLTIESSSLYLLALLNMGSDEVKNTPLLVQALEEETADSASVSPADTTARTSSDTLNLQAAQSDVDLIKNMTGKLSIEIPRNTWIRSEDMNIELYGNVDLLKNNEYFELFGSVGINRGYYTLYGRKLIIQKGQITFQGGREYNPNINLEAVYKFRGADKQKNELLMIATGSLMEPQLSFKLNNQSITERDAMAYLIFGKSFDQLSFSNQQGVSGNVPSALLSSLLSSQITKLAGNTFNLDMVEINANEDWESASFMVGKYITNNLFVTYQRGFGENKDESFTPQVITLEYELNRHIFLRLTQGEVQDSGIDIIFKFEKK